VGEDHPELDVVFHEEDPLSHPDPSALLTTILKRFGPWREWVAR
jgi:hypothetical protein